MAAILSREIVESNRALMTVLSAERAKAPHADTLTWIAMHLGIERGFCRYHLRKIGVPEDRVAALAGDPPPVKEAEEHHAETRRPAARAAGH